VANPLALLLAAGLMLEHVGKENLSKRLNEAIDVVLNKDKVRTRDLGGKAGTQEFAQALIGRLK
jgi:isocitrate dehydrogenase (NAD+)